jgi:hypothetical protein
MKNILMRIAREANRTGDAETLFHALDLLEHMMPIATGRVDAFMAFCAELETEGDGWKARLPCWHRWSRAASRNQPSATQPRTSNDENVLACDRYGACPQRPNTQSNRQL